MRRRNKDENSRTARHSGRIVPPPADKGKSIMRFSSLRLPTLFEVWLKVRGASINMLAESAGVVPNTVYNLLDYPDRARDSTLNTIAAAIRKAGGSLTGTEIAALASRRVRNPDRIGEEIDQALRRAAALEAAS